MTNSFDWDPLIYDCDPDCEKCHGKGYIVYPTAIEICPDRRKYIWSDTMGIDQEEIASLNWDKSLPTKPFKQMRALFDKLLERGYGLAYIYGPPGIGKTHVAKAAVVQSRYRYRKDARYTSHIRALNYLRESYGDENHGQRVYQHRLDEYSDIPFLVVDEIGRDRSTPFGVSALSVLLDARYEGSLSRKTITVLVSNFAPEAVLDDYQVDRIKDKRSDLLKVEGDSVRKVLTYEQAELLQDDEKWWQRL